MRWGRSKGPVKAANGGTSRRNDYNIGHDAPFSQTVPWRTIRAAALKYALGGSGRKSKFS